MVVDGIATTDVVVVVTSDISGAKSWYCGCDCALVMVV